MQTPSRRSSLTGQTDRAPSRPHLATILVVFLFPLLITCLVSQVVFGGIPHVQDSIAQLFQAKIFASGRLYASSHPLKEFFDYTNVINNGRWYCQYPPGHALMLALGVLIGVPWLINPLLGSLSVLFIYLVARRVYEEKTARYAALCAALSPFLIFMSSEFMSHASAMLFAAAAAYSYFRTLRSRRCLTALATGLLFGGGFLIRPYTALGVGLPFAVHGLAQLWRRPGEYSRPAVMVLAGLLPPLLALLAYNWLTNGRPLTFGYTVLYGPGHGLGFGKATWGELHTLGRGLADLWDTIKALNTHLLGWPAVTFLPIVILFLSRQARDTDYLLIGVFASLGCLHVFYWYHDLCLGPRFVYEALPFLMLLTARGIVLTPSVLSRLGRRAGDRTAGIERIVIAILALLFAYDILVTVPGLIRGRSDYFWDDRRYANSYWGVDPYLGRLVKDQHLDRALVFVNFDYPPIPFDPLLWFGSGFLHNSPGLDDKVIYARHLGSVDTLLMDYYSDRRCFIYEGKLRQGRLRPLRREELTSPR